MSDSANGSRPWNIQSARSLYNIDRWGAKYFDINEAGHVVATPLQEAGAAVELSDVVEEAKARGLKFPLLIRFQDILRHRVQSINEAFRGSIAEFNYQGKYRGVFPIKVNQLREVVEEILDAGKPYNFGLEVGSKPELLAAADLLKAENLTHCFKLIHFHIGSQVPDILTVKKAVQEAARFYAKLYKMGFPVEYIDVGGGLGVDYDGSRSAFDSSTNYTLQEYTNDVVYYIGDVCNAEKVPHPDIVSESGRALVAHHSVLIVEVFGAIAKVRPDVNFTYTENENPLVKELFDIKKNLCKLNKLEAYHDALERREDAHNMFTFGVLDLPDKAKIEHLYWEISQEVVQSFRGQAYIPEEIRKLEDSLGDQYLCNFSVFQSLLDHWALGQLFPIMPISRLNERPMREATLVDITCDSDGQINKFIDLRDVRDTLPLHQLITNGHGQEPYYLGFFLMGAYQDIMGDLHNLFGRVNEVHVFLDPDEAAGYYVEEVIEGSTIIQTLTSVQYDETELKRQMKAQIDEAIKSDKLKPSEAMRLLDDYERGLKAYTYLNI